MFGRPKEIEPGRWLGDEIVHCLLYIDDLAHWLAQSVAIEGVTPESLFFFEWGAQAIVEYLDTKFSINTKSDNWYIIHENPRVTHK